MILINLDLKLGLQENISLMQFDEGQTVRVQLFENNIAYNLDNKTIRLQGVKSDGFGILIPTTIIETNVLEFKITEQLTISKGFLVMQLLIFSESELKNSKIFSFYINESLQIGSVVASDNSFLELKNSLTLIDNWNVEFANKSNILEQLYTFRLNAIELLSNTNKDNLNTYFSKVKHTDEGGLAIKLINKTGLNSVKGTLVCSSKAFDNAVNLQSLEYDVIGVVLDNGIADGQEVWVTISGIALVLLENNTSSTRGNWCIAAVTDGRANMTQPTPSNGSTIAELQQHFKEIGHCIENKAAGTNVLAKCILHFN